MRLSDFLSGKKNIIDHKNLKSDFISKGYERIEGSQQQIKNLAPGQTLQAEILACDGKEVQIRLANEKIIQAKIEQAMNLEVGKTVIFEVKGSGQQIVLGPLFTNMAVQENVLKALEMAGLSVNDKTVLMTKQLMEASLPIDRTTLQQLYRETNLFPYAATEDIVYLHKMNMEITEENIKQASSYHNLTHQLVKGLNNIVEEFDQLFHQLIEQNEAENAIGMYRALWGMAREVVLDSDFDISAQMKEMDMPENLVIPEEMEEVVSSQEKLEQAGKLRFEDKVNAFHGEQDRVEIELIGDEKIGDNEFLLRNDNTIISELGYKESFHEKASGRLTTDTDMRLEFMKRLLLNEEPDFVQGLEQLDSLQIRPLLEILKGEMLITPMEIAERNQVKSLYRSMNKQLDRLTNILKSSNQIDSTVFHTVTNFSNNLDFLQQINQVYSYLQLPLHLQNGEAHGELYVYSNKKHLAQQDGKISALLHLDMEYLGPIDVYVAMEQEKVSTKFMVANEEMLVFLNQHMDELTSRIQKRGYQCSYEMHVSNEIEEKGSVLEKILGEEKMLPFAEYSFDVRT